MNSYNRKGNKADNTAYRNWLKKYYESKDVNYERMEARKGVFAKLNRRADEIGVFVEWVARTPSERDRGADYSTAEWRLRDSLVILGNTKISWVFDKGDLENYIRDKEMKENRYKTSWGYQMPILEADTIGRRL